MFTIRVEWQRGGETEYSMHQCATFQKQTHAADGRVVLAMDQDTDQPRDLILEPDHVVYIMNAEGRTIDTIRQQPRKTTS